MVLVKSGNIDRKKIPGMSVVLVRGLSELPQLWIMGIEGCPPHPQCNPRKYDRTLDHNKASYLIGGKVAWKLTRPCNPTKNELPNQQRSFRIFPSDLPQKPNKNILSWSFGLNDWKQGLKKHSSTWIYLKESMWYITCFSTNHRKKRSIHRNRRLVGGFNSSNWIISPS